MKFDINENRALYDLCRRYQYQYKKYNAIKEVYDQYWSKDIKKACKEAKNELDSTAKKIIMVVLSEFIHPNNTHLECEREVFEPCYGLFSEPRLAMRCDPVPRKVTHKVEVEDDKLYWFAEQLLEMWRR